MWLNMVSRGFDTVGLLAREPDTLSEVAFKASKPRTHRSDLDFLDISGCSICCRWLHILVVSINELIYIIQNPRSHLDIGVQNEVTETILASISSHLILTSSTND